MATSEAVAITFGISGAPRLSQSPPTRLRDGYLNKNLAFGVRLMPLLAGTPGDKTPLNYALLHFQKKDVPQLSKTPPLTGHGAAVAGKIDANLIQFRWLNLPQFHEGTMPYLLEKNPSVLRYTIAGMFAAQFAAISERNGVSGFQPRLPFTIIEI